MAFSPVTSVAIQVTEHPVFTKLRAEVPHVMLSNMGTEVVFFVFGDEETSISGAMPVFPKTQLLLNKGIGCPGILTITPTPPVTLIATLGIGG